MSHGGAYWLARRRVQPKGGNLIVIARAVACPFCSVVQAYDNLVFVDIRTGECAEAEYLGLMLVEGLQTFLHVFQVKIVEVR